MRRFACIGALAFAMAVSLGGCASMSDWAIDPSEWFSGDWFGNKKKLEGDRKPVFPEGVPGVTRGVPAELVKGNQPAADQDDPLSQQLAADEAKAKAQAKAKPKQQVAAKPPAAAQESRPTPVTVRRSDAPPPQQQTAAKPPAQPGQQPAAPAWPDPTPAAQPPVATRWPDPPAPGTQTNGVQWPDPPPPSR